MSFRSTGSPKTDRAANLKAQVRKNLGLKIFSLVLGTVIFLAVQNEQEATTTVAVRLVVHEPEDLVNTVSLPEEVRVRVGGTAGRLRTLDSAHIGPVDIDLTGLGSGESSLRIREEQLGLPPDVKVLAISPSVISLKLEPRAR